ncbi:exonuclease SbcCD subunit D [Fictibacillus barbaricus]|uniref:Nuclease SbcCD subunit D n=1 Tax=Fictibacillus barbaricus TaxID=182136 RepID=A0ABS2ZD91_9BACL|nr:exonuclease SbcCD subunit D [Fictibacillus barbaricus]MBN3545406.1 exonuclease subunit SbcD [Fictibacillus barbaricus]GGB59282.1 nuclease SbcCD subunit D [Fictibacillus barbaricus]
MRLLHTADWHLGRSLEGRSRLEEQQAFLDELVEIVRSEKIDAVLMAGDVFDTVNPPAAAEQMFFDALARISRKGTCPFVAIAGNHDHPDRLAASFPLSKELGITLVGLPTLELQRVPISRTAEMLEIAALPYPSESRLKMLLSESAEELDVRNQYDDWVDSYFKRITSKFQPGNVHMAMSHIYVAGSKETDSERPVHIGGAYTVAAESLPEAAQYVALGHLHRPQIIKRAKTEARYSGSPLSYSFSESGQTKSVTIIDVEPAQPAKVEEIHLNCGKPLVAWEARNGLTEVFQGIEEGLHHNCWVDLSVHVQDALSMEEIQRLRKAHDGLVHIKPVYTETIGEQISVSAQKLPVDELFSTFYKRQTGGAVPDEELLSLFLDLVGDEDTEGEEAG